MNFYAIRRCRTHQRITVIADDELEKYNVIIAQLRLVEDPVEQFEPINEVMTRIAAGNQRYITRRTVDAFIRNNPDFMASLGGEKITSLAASRKKTKTRQPNCRIMRLTLRKSMVLRSVKQRSISIRNVAFLASFSSPPEYLETHIT